MADESPFIIKELSGDQRVIRLVGRGLPYRPFSLEGKQRVPITWLAGSPTATSTILGPTEEPCQINGVWKDKFLGEPLANSGVSPPFQLNGQIVANVLDATDLIDDVRRVGQLLEVSWLNKVRRGFITSFRQAWHTTHDVEWTIEFSWISQGDDISAAVFVSDTQVADAANAMRGQLDDLDDIGTPDLFGFLDDVLNTLQTIQHTIEDKIAFIEDTVQNFVNKITSSINAARGIISTLTGIEQECRDMVSFLESSASGAIRSDKPVNELSYNETLATVVYVRQVKDWAQTTMRLSVQYRTQLVSQIQSNVIAVYTAKDGDDLRDVSKLYYNTPFEWRRLLVFNDFDNAELEPGQQVLIPKINPAQAGQQDPGN